MSGQWASRWFPDLGRADSASLRWEVWRAAYGPVAKSRSYFAIALLVQIAAQVLVGIPVARYLRAAGLSDGWVTWGVPVLLALIACLVILWLVRRRITRNIRVELTKRGYPTCTPCGYNLTGNTSGVCPECGRAC